MNCRPAQGDAIPTINGEIASTVIRGASEAFVGVLLDRKIALSMDGKGSWRDIVFVEQLWRNLKYEEIYLKAYDTVVEGRSSLSRYLDFNNRLRPQR